MKTILVPTDFSDIASNAVDYAAEIAHLINAEIILFHVYPIPTIPTETMVILPVAELEEGCMIGLHKIEKRLRTKYNNTLNIKCKCAGGFITNEINAYANEIKADLIVMGMEGAGYLTEKIIGTNTSALLKKAKCPVLAIHKNVKFKSIKKIMLACDYSDIEKKTILAPLKELAHLFKSHIYILNVAMELETIPTRQEAISGIKLDHALEDVDHSFHAAFNTDLVEEINHFATEQKIDMVVMIPHKHNIFQQIFHESNTKRTAFHSTIPILALH